MLNEHTSVHQYPHRPNVAFDNFVGLLFDHIQH